ncbi:MAG: IMP dehydrogenase [Nanoarchaeota archaeon]
MDIKEGLTFDDVLLVPKKTPVMSRKEVSVQSILTKRIQLNVPLVSANMDTVTESAMAIAMARQGGIGIIHRFLPIEKQVEEVQRVKRSESFIIEKPVTIDQNKTLKEAKILMTVNDIGGILVIDDNNDLSGILTNRDILFQDNPRTKISELMTPRNEMITAPYGISIDEAKKILYDHRIEKLPLLDKDGKIHGLITTKDISKKEKYPNASKDLKGRLLVGGAVGVKEDYIERATEIYRAGCDVLVIDIAHGHSDIAIKSIKEIRKNLGSVDLIAGNVATAEGCKELIKAGVDCVKIGVGPGAVCLEGDTPILMNDYTVKNIRDIKPGEKVITHKGRSKRVTKTYKRHYKGEILKLNVGGSPGTIKMTPEHPILSINFKIDPKKMKKNGSKYYFYKKKYTKNLNWIEAGSLKSGDVVVIPKNKPVLNKISFDLAKLMPEYNHDDKYIWSNKIGFNPNIESHGNIAKRFNTTHRIIENIVHGNKSLNMELNGQVNQYLDISNYTREIQSLKINRNIGLNKDFMRIIGYYLAEGFIGGYEKNKHLCFAFSSKELEYHEDIKRLINNIFEYKNSKILFKKDRNSATVQISNNIIARFFKSLIPGVAHTKKIPLFIINQDNELLRELLIGAIRGDGSIKEPRRVSYFTTSRNLAFQIAEIFVRFGYMPSINVGKSHNPNWNDKWRVSISGAQYEKFALEFPEFNIPRNEIKGKQQLWEDNDYIYLSIDNIKSVDDELDVYNIEVEEDNSYIANRIAVHNCSTRIVTGVGVPQLTAIMNCAKIANKENIPIMADGGIKNSGDISKAIAAGASTVMLGSLLAGTEESPGAIIMRHGRRFKIYRGMASFGANLGRKQRINNNNDIDTDLLDMTPEGIESLVEYKGYASEVITQLVNGLKSGVSYCGSKDIKGMQKNAEFIKMSIAGLKESHPHDVEVLK